ncbi:MAG: radical SAM protein [Acidobacteria bacterium]|nr:radical SAM protein [Acidobacteriota bacterium]
MSDPRGTNRFDEGASQGHVPVRTAENLGIETKGMPHFRSLVQRAARELIPLDISIELTWRCNFRCRHCYIPDFNAPNGVSTERLMRLLDELADMGTLFLALTGGEPLLRKDWALIARHARSLGFQVMLLTNGALIDEPTADRIAELGLQTEISFHSGDPAVFEAVTSIPGSFRAVRAAITRLRERGVPVELTVPLSTLNPDGGSSVPELAGELDVPAKVYTKIFARKDGNTDPLKLRLAPEDAVQLGRGGPETGCEIDDAEQPAGDGPLCAAGVRYANITPSGDVLACNVLPASSGNINEMSFREIWETSPWLAKLRKIRRQDLRGCATCSRLAYCGRCHAQALVEDGDILGPSSAACAYAEALEQVVKRRA